MYNAHSNYFSRIRFFNGEIMTLLIILLCVFGAVALMVILGERYGKPMEVEQQQKYSKILWIVVFISIIAAIIREMV